MKILYLDPNPDIKVERILQKIDRKFYTFNFRNHLQNIRLNFQREKGFYFSSNKVFTTLPYFSYKRNYLKEYQKMFIQ